jgi:hypothetical protein
MEMRSAVALAAIASLCGVPAPATADVAPTGVSALGAPMAKAKKQKVKFTPPDRVKERGTTVLLKQPTYTNAGRRIRVHVTTQLRHGGKTTREEVKVVRRKGRVQLEVSGLSWIRAEVRYRAKKAPGYAAYSKTKVYKSWVSAPQTEVPATGANAAGLEWKDVFSGLLNSVATDITGLQSIGWGVAFLFSLADDPKPDPMEQIQKALAQISEQLSAIDKKIDVLSKENAYQTCSAMNTSLASATATIQGQAEVYRNWVTRKNKDRKDFTNWADRVLDDRNGTYQAVRTIRNALTQQTNTPAVIGMCADAFRKTWEQDRPALAEDKYYSDVWTFLNYYYQIQIIALNNIVEAKHIQAVDKWIHNSSKPRKVPDPKDIATVCKDKNAAGLGDSPYGYCDDARLEATTAYYAMLAQAKAAGAAYNWNVDGKKAIAVRASTNELWVTDLNKYGDRSNCYGPVNSVRPVCGPTVGNDELMVTDGLAYDGWTIARAAQWRSLLGAKSRNDNAGKAMDKAGFPAVVQKDIIIYTGEMADANSSKMAWLSGAGGRFQWRRLKGNVSGGQCFFDTNMRASADESQSWLYCTDDQAFWYLANAYQEPANVCTADYHYTTSDVALSGTKRTGSYVKPYYDVDLKGVRSLGCYGGGLEYSQPEPVLVPGWMIMDGQVTPSMYLWPVQDVSTRKCLDHFNWGTDKSALQPKNAGGAWTMCGDDFKTWLKTQLPDPPK